MMINLCNSNGVLIKGNDPNTFSEDFLERINVMTRYLDTNAEILIAPTGLAIIKENNKVIPIGCHTCLGKDVEQNKNGYPVINKMQLLQNINVPSNLPKTLQANLWFCPTCHLPITKLLPKFGEL